MTRPRSPLALVLVFIASCATSSKAPSEPEAYLVRATGADAIPPTSERAVLRVAPVAVAGHIRGVAIVTADGRVRTMVNQRFAAPLDALVEEAVTDRLRAAGRYGIVLAPSHGGSAPFALRLTLRAFEIGVDSAGGYAARVAFDGLVEREGERKVLRSFRAAAERPAAGPEGGGFVRALEEAMNAAIDVVIQEVDAAGVGAVAPLLKSDSEPERTGG